MNNICLFIHINLLQECKSPRLIVYSILVANRYEFKIFVYKSVRHSTFAVFTRDTFTVVKQFSLLQKTYHTCRRHLKPWYVVQNNRNLPRGKVRIYHLLGQGKYHYCGKCDTLLCRVYTRHVYVR